MSRLSFGSIIPSSSHCFSRRSQLPLIQRALHFSSADGASSCLRSIASGAMTAKSALGEVRLSGATKFAKRTGWFEPVL